MTKPPGFARSKPKETDFKHPVVWNDVVVARTRDKRLAKFFALSLERAEIVGKLKAKGKSDLNIIIDLLISMDPERLKPSVAKRE